MYTPQKDILEKYAKILINFALNDGNGIKPGDVVYLVVPYFSKPLALEIYRAILKSNGHVIMKFTDEDFEKLFYQDANESQLNFFPRDFTKSLTDTIDHYVRLIGEEDPHYLEDVDPAKIMKKAQSNKPFRDWINKKEDEGKFTWTLGLYPTEGQAKEAGLSLKESWDQVIKACFLDYDDPISEWKSVMNKIEEAKNILNQMPINKLHIESEGTDLWITLGEKRAWNGGSGRNIPSFEIFTSPDWRGTEGTISFDQPLYRYGNLIEGIKLEFKNGRVSKASATKNEKVLLEMIKQKNADKVGEFSMTDKRFSRIDRFMAETLYDENFGGDYGNTHIALGMSYHDCYSGDKTKTSDEEWEELGYNDSVIHTDIISTKDRKITAYFKDGDKKVIFEDGVYTFV
ncbi:MAG: aminopeptidase [Candidatus Dojkabacteria bacterium]|nr:MAG: aminopeptidase [Candidatus Dojkabacteria bacterium]